jgi:hypothetical protein
MSVKGPPRLGSIEAACKLIGGDKPIHPGTFYRGVKRGIYPAPFRASPNVSRVDLSLRPRSRLAQTARPPEAERRPEGRRR